MHLCMYLLLLLLYIKSHKQFISKQSHWLCIFTVHCIKFIVCVSVFDKVTVVTAHWLLALHWLLLKIIQEERPEILVRWAEFLGRIFFYYFLVLAGVSACPETLMHFFMYLYHYIYYYYHVMNVLSTFMGCT